MLHNVEYASKPELYVYERNRGMACITLADNIREGVNANDEDCWFADLYMIEMPDNDNLAERLERNYRKFLEHAKEIESRQVERKPTVEERIVALEAELAELKSYVNSIGKTELVGKGTQEEPFAWTVGIELIPNTFYSYGTEVFVWMGKSGTADSNPPVDNGGDWVLW